MVSIGWNERVALVGKTGSGKTFLTRYVADSLRRLIVIDPKATIDPNDWNLDSDNPRSRKALRDGEDVRMLIRYEGDDEFEEAFGLAWAAGDITVYIDEMYGVVPPGKQPPRRLTALYTRGRERGIGVWSATQRPSWVPLFMLSESEWFFVFRLQLEEDRKRMAQFMGPQVMKPVADKFGFYMYNVAWNKPTYHPKLVPPGVKVS